jgi:hypothetical protein
LVAGVVVKGGSTNGNNNSGGYETGTALDPQATSGSYGRPADADPDISHVTFCAKPSDEPEVNGNEISPIAECVVEDGDQLTARFGYETGYGQTVTVPYGPNNKLTPTQFDGTQPEVFEVPNIYQNRPGRTVFDAGVFEVTFDPDEIGNVVWTLGNSTATASDDTKRCPCEASDFTETVNNQERRIEVVIEDPEGIQTVNFRNDNQNNSPLLENLTVELEEATGGTLERDDSSSDIDWSAGSTAPTRVVLHLNQENENVKSFAYYLRTTNGCGTETVIDPVGELPVSVDALSLQGNYPNPFSDRTTLAFALPEAADVTLTVYDVMGRKVATLQEGRLPAGAHEVRWDGRADGGTELASGLYIARLTAGDQTRTQRLTIVR